MSWLLDKILSILAPSVAKFGYEKTKTLLERRGAKKEYALDDLAGVWRAQSEDALVQRFEIFSRESRKETEAEDVFGEKRLFSSEIVEKKQLRLAESKLTSPFFFRKESNQSENVYVFKIISPVLIEVLHAKISVKAKEEKPLFKGRYRKVGVVKTKEPLSKKMKNVFGRQRRIAFANKIFKNPCAD